MKGNRKTYWKGIEQLTNDSEFVKHAENEFPEKLPIKDAYGDNTQKPKTSRRDFLKMMGFSVAAVSLAACETPVKKAIPYLNKPENVDPGVANYYASTYLDGSDYCSVLVRTREGRPIFVTGNTASNFTKGGIDTRATASIMSLYDIERQKEPTKAGEKVKWADVDKEVMTKLDAGGEIRVVTNTVMSPSTKRAIAELQKTFSTVKHITYDPVSNYGMLKANQQQFGKAIIPSYDFGKADTIASIGADFLGSWISHTEYSKQFAAGRRVGKGKKEMNRLYAFESILSSTGASADYRGVYKPSQEGLVVAKLYNLVAKKVGGTSMSTPDIKVNHLEKCADDLVKSKGKALVVADSNDVAVQMTVNAINQLLGSYGKAIDMNSPSFQKQGNDEEMAQFVKDITGGKIASVIFYNCNPVYDHPQGSAIATGISKAKLSIATSDRLDETAKLCQFNCPDNHYLESWNDAEPKKGFFSLGQPTITPIFNTRQVQESLLKWAGSSQDYLSFIQAYWKSQLFPLQSKNNFDLFWKTCLHDGVFEPKSGYKSIHEGAKPTISSTIATPIAETVSAEDPANVTADDVAPTEPVEEVVVPVSTTGFNASTIASVLKKKYKADSAEKELIIYEGSNSGTGSQANNPYIQETPDPINKMCWGHVISVSPVTATELGFSTQEAFTNVATVKSGNFEATLPVLIQPGQAKDTIAVALGYGRSKEVGKVATEAGGFNAYPALSVVDGTVHYSTESGVTISDAGETEKLSQTQTHETILGRETIIQETTLGEYQKDPKAGRFFPMIATYKDKKDPKEISIWDIDDRQYEPKEEPKTKYEKNLWNNRHPEEADRHKYPIHHWGLVIDLNSCTGCTACVVACHIENNVSIVGKAEVQNRREMHWLRIDRYYSSDGAPGDYAALELAAENPEVVFQPMMCQHCNNAPCETVCPVAATTHSSEGLNQMTYNRCVGTKYCANNCPYKVRRFNWFKYYDNSEFDYHMNNDLGKMVLNPDVTVRSRGVMEKCSMCVQRIQEGKLKAKVEGRKLKDGDIMSVCSAACSSGAMIFGDLNDPESEVSQLLDAEFDGRAYNVLHEIGTKPNVWYLTKVRNRDEVQETAQAETAKPEEAEAH